MIYNIKSLVKIFIYFIFSNNLQEKIKVARWGTNVVTGSRKKLLGGGASVSERIGGASPPKEGLWERSSRNI